MDYLKQAGVGKLSPRGQICIYCNAIKFIPVCVVCGCFPATRLSWVWPAKPKTFAI